MEDIKTLLQENNKEIRKDIEKSVGESEERVRRHFDVAKEDFEHKLQLVAEAVFGIQEQLIAIKEMVAKNTEDIQIMKMDIQFIKQELKHKVDRDEFEALEKRMGILEAKV